MQMYEKDTGEGGGSKERRKNMKQLYMIHIMKKR